MPEPAPAFLRSATVFLEQFRNAVRSSYPVSAVAVGGSVTESPACSSGAGVSVGVTVAVSVGAAVGVAVGDGVAVSVAEGVAVGDDAAETSGVLVTVAVAEAGAVGVALVVIERGVHAGAVEPAGDVEIGVTRNGPSTIATSASTRSSIPSIFAIGLRKPPIR